MNTKQNMNARRGRGRNLRNNRRLTVVQDSQPVGDGRSRGQLTQAYERYMNLAREAKTSGDRVLAEGFYQHAEHCFRTIALIDGARPAPAPAPVPAPVLRNVEDASEDDCEDSALDEGESQVDEGAEITSEGQEA